MEEEHGRSGGLGQPHGSAAHVLQALLLLLLLLLLLGGQGQGSTPGRCDCANDSQKRYGSFCCRGCPKGHYMKASCTELCGNSTCLPCPQGTFLAREYHFNTDCTRCQACDEEASNQVSLENCSAVSDRRCGCPSGWLLVCSVEPCRASSPFSCSCLDCVSSSTPDGFLHIFWIQVLLGASFLLGVSLICAYCRFQPHKPMVPADTAGMDTLTASPQKSIRPPGGKHPHIPDPTSGLPLAPLLSPAPPAGSPAAMLQPGPQLYDVMDAVPARRWKEFVRTLGLREAEIEAVEVEICRFRDQQYEMLKRWRQQQPADLGAIYAALERMGLEGCAEDLRSRLQHGGR
ncbi:tumor necrosis factor receptor superfamily member 25 isoform X1 [Sigmodon hispidus]